MNYNVILKPEAEKDAETAALWYEMQSPGLGVEFLESLEEKISIIKSNPHVFELKNKEIRHAYFHRFPYAVHYIIDEYTIYVLAILHTSINPERWPKSQ